MDEELILKLKQAGTHVIVYAIESASVEVQNRIGKKLDLEKARQIIYKTDQQGILVGGFFMLGFPGETKEQMLQTIEFAKNSPFCYVNFFYVTPMPNTALFKELELDDMDKGRVRGSLYQRLSYNLSSVSDRQLERIWKMAFREFYFRPSQMWRMWWRIPNKKIILRNAFVIVFHVLSKFDLYDSSSSCGKL
jgi:radical SAM superfamily enzyme YgiQ (UPF0313 family)